MRSGWPMHGVFFIAPMGLREEGLNAGLLVDGLLGVEGR
jgi:hypothetical protein